jgi:hypothetical protein
MKNESIESGLPGWLEQLLDDAAGSPMFTVKNLFDDGWHSGDIAVFYVTYAHDKHFRELIRFCDTHGLCFETLSMPNANSFRLLVYRSADYEKMLQTGRLSDSSLFGATDIQGGGL